MNRRIIFDTSTLVSAALRPESVPRKALIEAFARWDLCLSPETLAELDRVLSGGKFDRYLSRTERRQFVALIRRHAQHFNVEPQLLATLRPPCRDPQDNKLLALALAAEATVIVSSDEDLLVLHPWNGIPVFKPREFLARYSGQ